MEYKDIIDRNGNVVPSKFKEFNYLKQLKKAVSEDYYNQMCKLLGLTCDLQKTGKLQHGELLLSNMNYVNLYFVRAQAKEELDQAYQKAKSIIKSFTKHKEYTKFAEGSAVRGLYEELLRKWEKDIKSAYALIQKLSKEDSINLLNTARAEYSKFLETPYEGAKDLHRLWTNSKILQTIINSEKSGQNE